MQSVTKSVTSALIGVAIGRGEIAGVDVPVTDFLGDYEIANLDEWKQSMTLRDLLTMRAGIAWDEDTVPYTDPANSCAGMENSDDWIQFVIDQPMSDQPGERFVYNSGASQLLSLIIKKATGRHVDEYAREHLFGPLGITGFAWKTTPTGHPDTEGGLYLIPRDLAKIGYLYLMDGVWDGARVLPEGWVSCLGRAQRRRHGVARHGIRLPVVARALGIRKRLVRVRGDRLRRATTVGRAGDGADRRLHRVEHSRFSRSRSAFRSRFRDRGGERPIRMITTRASECP